MHGLHLVDSSGWLEYLAEGPNAGRFAEPLSDPARLVVPTISLFEVFRVVLRARGEEDAFRASLLMRQGREVPLSSARAAGATLWTQDVDFEGIAGVRYFAKVRH